MDSNTSLELSAIVCLCTYTKVESVAQPPASPVAKRAAQPSSVSLGDFKLLILRQESVFGLPESVSLPQESLSKCAARIARRYVTAGLGRPTSLGALGHTERLRKTGGAAVAYLIPCTEQALVKEQAGTTVVSLQQAVEHAQENRFMADYNEAVLCLAGYLRRTLQRPEDAQRMFGGIQKYPLQQQMNPLFLQPNMHLRDACFRSWNNPHFKSGALRPEDAARRVSDTVNRQRAEQVNDLRFNRLRGSTYEIEGAERSEIDDSRAHVFASGESSNSGDDGNGAEQHVTQQTRGSSDTINNSSSSSSGSSNSSGSSGRSDSDGESGRTQSGLPPPPPPRATNAGAQLRPTSREAFNPMQDDLQFDFTNPLYEGGEP